MTNGHRIRLRQTFDVLVGIASASAWVISELNLQLPGRLLAGACCLLGVAYCGWRFEHYRTYMKRTDATMVAFYWAELLRRGGAESLRSLFGQFLEKKESFDNWGCTDLMLSERVSDGLSKFIRDQGKAAK